MSSFSLLQQKKHELVIRKKQMSMSNLTWARKAYVSESTLKRFLKGNAVRLDSFVSIIEVLGISEWEEYANSNQLSKEAQDSTQVLNPPPSGFTSCSTWGDPKTALDSPYQLLNFPQDSDRVELPCGGFFTRGKVSLADKKTIEVTIDRLKKVLLKCKVTISPSTENSQELVATGRFKESDRYKAIALLDHLQALLLECELEVW